MQITKGKVKKPLLMIIYGTEGVGKTEFCTKFKKPFFIDLEGGTENYDVSRSRSQNYFEIKDFLSNPKNLEEYSTIIIDSLDWLENSMHKALCDKARVNTVEELGSYGKWVLIVQNEWDSFINVLKFLRNGCNKNIIMTAHYQVKSFNDPLTHVPYDRYLLKLNDKASAKLREWCDMVLFATFETFTKTTSTQDKKGKGVGTGTRVLYTEKRPSHDAKNRFNLPYLMPLDYDTLISAVLKSNEDQCSEIISDINDLLVDINDPEKIATIKAYIEENKTKLINLQATKNRLLVIKNGE